jgi:hypothetical protein
MGLTKKDMENILAEVKANIARLQGCDIPHDFKPTSGKNAKAGLIMLPIRGM